MNPFKILLNALIFVAITVGAFVCANYSGGYVALKYFGDVSLLEFNTFHQIIGLASDSAYKKVVGVAWLGFSLPVIAYVIFLGAIIAALIPKKIMYGDARLSTDRDLAESGFFPSKSQLEKNDKPFCFPPILIGKMHKGKYAKQFIHFYGQQFLILYAPTRSGKGVSLVIPNCVNYPDSMIVLDIKLENWFLSAGWRKSRGHECFLFAPAGYSESVDELNKGNVLSHCWNPIDCVSRSKLRREADLKTVAAILMPAEGDAIWYSMARDIFVALGLYLFDKELVEDTKVSISAILNLSMPLTGSFTDWMSGACNDDFVCDEVKTRFQKFISMPSKTFGSGLSNFHSYLEAFSNPITAAATDRSDFDVRTVRKKKQSIYLGLTPDALITHSKLINLFFSMFVNENSRELPEQNADLKYQCLVLLDEFTSMGKSAIIEKGVGFMAGYNIRFMFILQNKGQLQGDEMYGLHGTETFVENSAVEIYFPPKTKNDLTKEISEKIGVRDFRVVKKSRTMGKNGTVTRNDDVMARAVILPEEIVSLRDHKNKLGNMAVREIIMSENCRPFVANKIVWFEEPLFCERVSFAKQNRVKIPCLFSDEQKTMLIPEIVSGGVGYMSPPDLDTYDIQEVSE